MEIKNKRAIEIFIARHGDSRVPMEEWIEKTESARWRNFAELRQTYRSSDYKSGIVIFNVGGNNYRLLAVVNYAEQLIRVWKLGTHSEYDRWKL